MSEGPTSDEPKDEAPKNEPLEALGLTGATAAPLARVLIRRRESAITTSAWRLEVTCDQGAGGIVRVEGAPGQVHYRGEGLFLGATQERMAEIYRILTQPPEGSGSDLELLQLG